MAPVNQYPVILSLRVFPNVINRTDSVIVICGAADRDGDTLVYDWETEGRLAVQGAPSGTEFLYNTLDPTRVFYPAYVNSPVDTAWVECCVRDRRGGEACKIVHLIVRTP